MLRYLKQVGVLLCVMNLLTLASYSQKIAWSINLADAVGPGFISPEVGDLDGNPANGNEIVVATRSATVTALNSGGGVLWQTRLPSANCAGLSTSDMAHSSPVIGVLNQSETPSVVIGYGSMSAMGCDGGIIALNGLNGAERWRFSVKDHAASSRYFTFRYGTVGKPAISTFMSGGKAFVAFGSLSHYIYLLRGDGSLSYFYVAGDTVFSSPSFFKNHVGLNVFAIGQDISSNSAIKPATKNGGYLDVFAVGPKSSRKIGFRAVNRKGNSGLISLLHFNQTVQSSPSVANLLSTSPGPEIFVNSGCFFPQGSTLKNGRQMSMVDAANKRVLASYPLSACSLSTPEVIKSQNIVVVLDNGLSMNGGPGVGKLIALRPSAVEKRKKKAQPKARIDAIWSTALPDVSQWQSPKHVILPGAQDGIALVAGGRVRVYRATDGSLYGSVGISGSTMDSSLAEGDLNADGRSEMIAVAATGNVTRVTAITLQ